MLRFCIPTLWVLFLVVKCVPDSAISTSWVMTSRPHLALALTGSTPQFHCEISDNPQEVHYEVLDKIVTVESPKEILTNGLPYSVNGYLFPVKVVTDNHIYDTTMGYSETRFDCKVEPPYVGFAKPWLDPVTLKLCCIFFPHFPEKLVHTAPDSADIWRGLSISIHASLLKDNRISGSASALFVGGFSLLDRELNLTSRSFIGYVTIVGNPNVEINNWHQLYKLSITTLEGGSKEQGHAVYKVWAHPYDSFKDVVIISLPATGQRMELIVSYETNKLPGVIGIKSLLFLVSLALVFLMYLILQLLLELESQAALSTANKNKSRCPHCNCYYCNSNHQQH